MAKRTDRDIAELLSRAEADAAVVKASREKPSPAEQKQSNVLSGAPKVHARTREPNVQQTNDTLAPAKKRRSTFNIIAWLFISAIAIVFYIGNILKVNRLAVEVHQLRVQYEKIQNTNSILQADINRKSGWERIGNAAAQHGLVHASAKPRLLDVDSDKLDEFKEK